MEDWKHIDIIIPTHSENGPAPCVGTRVILVETGELMPYVREVRLFMRFDSTVKASVERIEVDDRGNPIINPDHATVLTTIDRYHVRRITMEDAK